jgi:hypothetical protein
MPETLQVMVGMNEELKRKLSKEASSKNQAGEIFCQ